MELIVDFPPNRRCSFASTSSSENRSQRRVTFGESSEVKIVKNLRVDHKADLWLTKEDIDRSKVNIVRLFRALEKRGVTLAQFASHNVEDTSVFMGLEKHFSSTTSKEILSRRENLYTQIYSEESRQQKAGIYDPVKLAHISEECTEFCRRRARIVALLHSDEKSEKQGRHSGNIML
mmetsp:Transcript_22313/g.38297  ORF Transcript_22313/g.38297 Transcript_22313/m.38297 type:complete len:177 (-) Transcript_22313:30-560(-)